MIAHPHTDRNGRIDPNTRWGRGMVFAWLMNYPWQEAIIGIQDAVHGRLAVPVDGTVDADNWPLGADGRYAWDASSGTDPYYQRTGQPFTRYPFSILCEFELDATSDQVFYAFAQLGSNHNVYLGLADSGKLTFQVRQAGGTANSTNWLKLQGGTLSTGTRYRAIGAIHGDQSDFASLHYWAAGASIVTTVKPATSFGVGFPVSPITESIGGLSGLEMNGRLYAACGWDYAFTPANALALLRDPLAIYDAVRSARRLNDTPAFPASTFPQGSAGVNRRLLAG